MLYELIFAFLFGLSGTDEGGIVVDGDEPPDPPIVVAAR